MDWLRQRRQGSVQSGGHGRNRIWGKRRVGKVLHSLALDAPHAPQTMVFQTCSSAFKVFVDRSVLPDSAFIKGRLIFTPLRKRHVARTLMATTTYGGTSIMRLLALAALMAISSATGALAQQATPSQSLQNEADKGIKTQNSGASGYVGEQDKPGSASHMPGDANRLDTSGTVSTAPSAQNSGAGISGAPGGKNGPSQQGTVGSASQNLSVQEQDPANVKGLPGNKSGPPAKR